MDHKRPHKWPCVCEDCCAPFDPNVDFTGEPMVFRPDRAKPVDQGMPLEEFCKRMMAIAVKATGRTEEQLKEMAKQIGSPFPERKIVIEKPHWSEQREREPGEDDE